MKSAWVRGVRAGSLLLPLLLAGCASWFGEDQVEVQGEITYLQRMALPPEAEVEVRLQDITQQDVVADSLAATRFRMNGRQVPVPYRLSVPASWLDSDHRYAVSAKIELFGKAWYVTDTVHPLPSGDGPHRVDIQLVRAKGDSAQ